METIDCMEKVIQKDVEKQKDHDSENRAFSTVENDLDKSKMNKQEVTIKDNVDKDVTVIKSDDDLANKKRNPKNNSDKNVKFEDDIIKNEVNQFKITYNSNQHLHRDHNNSYHKHHHQKEVSPSKKNKQFSKPYPVKNKRFNNKNTKMNNNNPKIKNKNYKLNKVEEINNTSEDVVFQNNKDHLPKKTNQKNKNSNPDIKSDSPDNPTDLMNPQNKRKKCRRKRKAGEHHRRNSWLDEPSPKKGKDVNNASCSNNYKDNKLQHLPMAPHNSNQFLMEDHGQQNTPSPFHTPVRMRGKVRRVSVNEDDNDEIQDESYLDSEDNLLNSDEEGVDDEEDEDESYISVDFQKDYDQLRADMLAAMTKEELIRECMKLETMLESCQKEKGKLVKALASHGDIDSSLEVNLSSYDGNVGAFDGRGAFEYDGGGLVAKSVTGELKLQETENNLKVDDVDLMASDDKMLVDDENSNGGVDDYECIVANDDNNNMSKKTFAEGGLNGNVTFDGGDKKLHVLESDEINKRMMDEQDHDDNINDDDKINDDGGNIEHQVDNIEINSLHGVSPKEGDLKVDKNGVDKNNNENPPLQTN